MNVSIWDVIMKEDLLYPKTDKQKKILEASIKLFAEKGYANTSTAEIAKVAGVSVGTLFNYYKTKETLLLAIILPAINSFIPEVITENDQNLMAQMDFDFEGFLTMLIKARFMFVKKNKELYQVIIKEVLYREELRSGIFDYASNRGLPFLNGVVEYFKRNGEIRDLPTEEIVKYIITNLAGLLISSVLTSIDKSMGEKEIDELVSIMMDGLKNKR